MDKLPAVSGLAQSFLENMKLMNGEPDVYLAGLWKGDLIPSLLRCVVGWDHTKPSEYRAPSWSWASINGRIKFEKLGYVHRLESQISINEISCTPVSSLDPTGAVKTGRLVVTGPLTAVQLVVLDGYRSSDPCDGPMVMFSERNPAHFIRGPSLKSYEVSFDIALPPSLRAGAWCCGCWRTGYECSACSFDFDETSQFFCLELCTTKLGTTYYLLLKRSRTIQDAFEKVGVGRIRGGVMQRDGLFGNAEEVTLTII
ncbi:uncharacterized protein BDZ99DRAFT_517395 [Mytilinidion resinicola]|uniref:Uncharacterized protein n=1 Tax=Mytilinidion resinicola TaxID=574789 RepID=A0A6A6YYS5_9PEZI|nr:uncharacterized protein BDZ99DRAFT_517395 [Mytilinidion resinicola]KAF2813107.1 hypothetical protein BDZ99DRAFT_517395 [Mytilinidion resinicola]